MATTSLRPIGGDLGKTANYIENAEKTSVPMENRSSADPAGDPGPAALRKLITGIHVDPERAREQMLLVKRKFEKTGGTAAYHGHQSFAGGEVTPDLAHRIGVALAQELWGARYQVVVCTHIDKKNHLQCI